MLRHTALFFVLFYCLMNRMDNGGESMDWKLYVSSLIFVSVTILKLIFPDQTAILRRQAVTFIDMDMDYQKSIMAIGSLLTENSVQEVMGEMEMVQETVNSVVDATVEELSVDLGVQSQEVVTEVEVSNEVLQRVEAFRSAQEAYSEYETPVNVSYDNLVIPFSYAAPVTAVCSSGFGYRIHPIEGQVLFHYGTDYDVEEGTNVLSFGDGIVTAFGEEAGYGKYICVDHGDGWETLYAHCSDISVSAGQVVSKGEVIGQSGSTGRVTGPHLHFELIHNDLYTNPEFFLP